MAGRFRARASEGLVLIALGRGLGADGLQVDFGHGAGDDLDVLRPGLEQEVRLRLVELQGHPARPGAARGYSGPSFRRAACAASVHAMDGDRRREA